MAMGILNNFEIKHLLLLQEYVELFILHKGESTGEGTGPDNERLVY